MSFPIAQRCSEAESQKPKKIFEWIQLISNLVDFNFLIKFPAWCYKLYNKKINYRNILLWWLFEKSFKLSMDLWREIFLS